MAILIETMVDMVKKLLVDWIEHHYLCSKVKDGSEYIENVVVIVEEYSE